MQEFLDSVKSCVFESRIYEAFRPEMPNSFSSRTPQIAIEFQFTNKSMSFSNVEGGKTTKWPPKRFYFRSHVNAKKIPFFCFSLTRNIKGTRFPIAHTPLDVFPDFSLDFLILQSVRIIWKKMYTLDSLRIQTNK